MRIVCIAASFVPSNTANSIQVIKATHALAELGHEVTLLVPGNEESDWEDVRRHYGLKTPFEIRWLKENLTFRRYDFAYKATRLARQCNPDVIYTWVLQAAVIALRQRIPVVLELHDRVTGKLGPWLFHQFYGSRTRRRLLTNTKSLRDVLMADLNLTPDKFEILVAPNGVDLEEYQNLPSPSESRQHLGLPEGFTAGYTGHFYAGRGMDLMLDLVKGMPSINFLWVGGELEDVAFWKNRLESEDVQNITLTGFVDHDRLPIYQAAADVLLMPYGTAIAGSGGGDSAEVASPMKMFEYLASGRPIISSDLPVLHEVLDETKAIFCPPEDLSAWKRALQALIVDPLKCESLGEAARQTAKNYTWRARAERAIEGFEGE